jgi:hypothetical protein
MALIFRALRLQGLLGNSGSRQFSILLEETEGTAGVGNKAPPKGQGFSGGAENRRSYRSNTPILHAMCT